MVDEFLFGVFFEDELCDLVVMWVGDGVFPVVFFKETDLVVGGCFVGVL